MKGDLTVLTGMPQEAEIASAVFAADVLVLAAAAKLAITGVFQRSRPVPKRIYQFPLPYRISGIQDAVGVSDLKDDGLWDQIPADLQAKLEAGDGWFSGGVQVTQAELDELPDAVWTYIAGKLGLPWCPA